MTINAQTVREAVKSLRLARDDLDMLATDGRLAALKMNNGASALDWAGTALVNVRAALTRLDKGLGDQGGVAVEYALALLALGFGCYMWIEAADALVAFLWPRVECGMSDLCAGRPPVVILD